MWGIQQAIHTLIAVGRRRRRADRPIEHPVGREAGPGTDWLPPVLGPQDWQIALMADRSAGWYFDRR